MTSSRSDVIRGRAAYAGMSVPQLAEKVGIPRSTMSERVRDPGSLRVFELGRISQVVGGLSADDIAALGIRIRRGL